MNSIIFTRWIITEGMLLTRDEMSAVLEKQKSRFVTKIPHIH